MHFCPHCETLLPPDAATCPACGAAAPAQAPAWTATLPALPSHAPVAFAGGVLLACGSPEHTAALEWRARADGQPRWQRTFDHALITGLVILEDHLLLSLTSTDLLRGQGALVMLEAAGDEVWQWAGGVQQVSAPAVAGATVYLTADATHLIAVDVATGAEQSRWTLPVSAARAAPAVAGDTLFIPCRGPHLLAWDVSGALRWRFDAALPETAWLHHTPLLHGDTVFTVSSAGQLLALEAETGKLRWQVPIGPPGRALSPLVTEGGYLYVGARDGLHALDFDGQPCWHFPTQYKITAAPVVAGGVVYAACWDRQLYAVDAATGRELWRYAVERHSEVSPLIFSTDSTDLTESSSSVPSVPSVEKTPPYALIADAGGTVTALLRPLSAAELEAAGAPYQAAQLWESLGQPERTAIQYETAGRWERAADLWRTLDHPLRQAESLQQHARALPDEAAQAALWEQAATLYADHGQPALAEQCQREVARCRHQPALTLDIEHEGLLLNDWTVVRFIVRNAGFGPARDLVIHTDKQCFEGQVTYTQRIATLEAGGRDVQQLDLKPRESGASVPLRITMDFADHTGQPLQCTQTVHLPVARESAARAAPTHTQVLRAAPRFVDLAVRVFRRNVEGYYPVEMTLANQQQFVGAITADLRAWTASGDPDRDGHALFAALTADPALAEAWARCRGRAEHRRVRLWLDTGAPELHGLPWELLRDNDLPLAASAATPFSRYLPTPEAWGDAVTTRPIRLLAVVATPTDLADYALTPLDVVQEQAILRAALPNTRDFQVDFLEAPATLDRLEERLRDGYHLLHLVGHGNFSTRKQQAALYLQAATGKAQVVTETDFAAMLARHSTRPSLLTLAACHGATRATADAWRGLAPALVQAGIPAAIAMQGAIPLATAQAFTGAFYRALIEHGAVDVALNQARSLLISQGRAEVTLPVLVMRLMDGQVW